MLERYKETIDRWLWLDVLRNQDTSVSQAKRAISHYKKAVGDPEELAELMVFYCEPQVALSTEKLMQTETRHVSNSSRRV